MPSWMPDFENFHTDDWIAFLLLSALVICLGFLVIYGITYAWQTYTVEWSQPRGYRARVKDLSYQPSRSSSGVSPVVMSGGQVGVVSTSSSTPEKWAVVFQLEEGGLIVENSKELFEKLEQGDRVELDLRFRTIMGDLEHEIVAWRKL